MVVVQVKIIEVNVYAIHPLTRQGTAQLVFKFRFLTII